MQWSLWKRGVVARSDIVMRCDEPPVSKPDPNPKAPSMEAPVIGCVTGGCVVPLVWMAVGAAVFHGGSSGWTGVPIVAVLLAPFGFFCGLLFSLRKDRKVTLSDDALRAELQSMSMESLREYKAL